MVTLDAINVCQRMGGQQLWVSGWSYASRNVQNVTARRGAVLKDMAVSQSHGLGKSHLGRLPAKSQPQITLMHIYSSRFCTALNCCPSYQIINARQLMRT
jgi:hypothetical protein